MVAMSGGVDSSVVAALLHEQGYDVVGITLQLYDHGEAVGKAGSCCAGQDIHDARRVAAQLGIPHYVLDYEQRFAESVMSEFADSYLAGETPIPCVNCNAQVKFKDLLTTARELGADVLATGHYVAARPVEGGYGLYRAADSERDQSYFLFSTTREQLQLLRFPLGSMHKSETRALAQRYGLKIADKPDSQDICFVPTGRYTHVIERLRPGAAEKGNIVHVDGRVLGEHGGIVNYTIGQRRGIGVADREPLYVVQLDADRREVIVGPKDYLAVREIDLRDVNWLGDQPFYDLPEDGVPLYVKVRSSQAPIAARLLPAGKDATVKLECAENGVSPGQACVFYDAAEGPARVLGGGWIRSTGRLVAALANRSSPSVQEHRDLAAR